MCYSLFRSSNGLTQLFQQDNEESQDHQAIKVEVTITDKDEVIEAGPAPKQLEDGG